MKIAARGASTTELKLALGRMAPTGEQAALLIVLTKTVSLLEPTGLYDMQVEVIQPDVMGAGITHWQASFLHVGGMN